jgi:ABC-type transport system involved in cytochrome bd biosynthesis fused ATPase/permease subunit
MALIGVTTGADGRQYAALAEMAGRFLDLLRGLTTLGFTDRRGGRLTRCGALPSCRRRTMSTLRVAFLSGLVLDLIAAVSVAMVAGGVGLRLDGAISRCARRLSCCS